MTAHPDALRPGMRLGRYELLVPIAAGGMASVWAARLTGTRGFSKIVAVKTLLPALSDDPDFEQMFLDEATLAARIRHPNMVETFDLGEENGVLYLVMEWVDGQPLNVLRRVASKKGGIPLPVAVRIVSQACAVLHVAHELRDGDGRLVGLVHRDVSPHNVMVTYDGGVKVLDFGVAKALGRTAAPTAAGTVKGKSRYLSPEQIRGAEIDRRTDVFALGILLFYLTTGKHPFAAESEQVTAAKILSPDPSPRPSSVQPGYPPALERVVMNALAKEPAERYATANDMLRELDRALPADMRASTDEEVGALVRVLVGDMRTRMQEELAEALRAADERAIAKDRTTLAPPEPIRKPLPSGSGEWGIPGGSASPSEAPSATTAGAAIIDDEIELPIRPRRKGTSVVVGAVLGVAGLIAVLALVMGRKTPAAPTSNVMPNVAPHEERSAAPEPRPSAPLAAPPVTAEPTASVAPSAEPPVASVTAPAPTHVAAPAAPTPTGMAKATMDAKPTTDAKPRAKPASTRFVSPVRESGL